MALFVFHPLLGIKSRLARHVNLFFTLLDQDVFVFP
jgi:hypothetical protein